MRLAELLDDAATIVVYATSVASEAMIVADELVLIDEHRILQRGAPLDVYRDPQNRRVADLTCVPRANWMPPDVNHPLAQEVRRRGEALGFRPEHLQIAAIEAGDAFDTHVSLVETDGTVAYVHVMFGAEPWVVRTMIDATTLALEPGTPITIHASPDDRIWCRG